MAVRLALSKKSIDMRLGLVTGSTRVVKVVSLARRTLMGDLRGGVGEAWVERVDNALFGIPKRSRF
jgi:hypothetical protein